MQFQPKVLMIFEIKNTCGHNIRLTNVDMGELKMQSHGDQVSPTDLPLHPRIPYQGVGGIIFCFFY